MDRKEQMREASRRWYANNREKSLARAAEWHKANPERAREKSRRCLAKTRPAGSTYNSWRGMLDRCRNVSHRFYKNYGGRGIKICARWDPRQGGSFANFLGDMGERPPGLTLDRVDNDGDYTPENCRWATRKQQVDNARPKKKHPIP